MLPQVFSVAIQSVPSDHQAQWATVQDSFLCFVITRCKECFAQRFPQHLRLRPSEPHPEHLVRRFAFSRSMVADSLVHNVRPCDSEGTSNSREPARWSSRAQGDVVASSPSSRILFFSMSDVVHSCFRTPPFPDPRPFNARSDPLGTKVTIA